MTVRLAIVEADADEAEVLAGPLRAEGYDTTTYRDGASALDAFERGEPVDLVLAELAAPRLGGLELCAALKLSRPELPVVVLAHSPRIDTALSALRAGAWDYLATPVDFATLLPSVHRAITRRLARRPALHTTTLTGPPTAELLGDSVAMQRVRAMVTRVSGSGASVLIHGETGTGKELVARALHAQSSRRAGPFVALDCAALPGTLLESELFGHARGAFTDARAARSGLFVEASGGTLFLDEVAELSLDNQARVLRALQERRVRPLGSNTEVPFDARVVCATHKTLEVEVAAGRFRQDLFYRLNVVRIALPPLRERGLDIVYLASLFLARACARDGVSPLAVPPEVTQRLLHYAWPGNVRELENCMEQLAALARGEQVSADDLPRSMRGEPRPLVRVPQEASDIVTLDEFERRYVLRVLELLHDNRSRAADLLGIDRRTLYRRLEAWGLPTWRTPPQSPGSPTLGCGS
jgi:two-component system response regulator HydG